MKSDAAFSQNDMSMAATFSQNNESFGVDLKDGVMVGGGGGSYIRISEVELPAAGWVSVNDRKHYQVVQIEGATENSQVDLTPDADQLEIFNEKYLCFVTENEDGVVTVFAIGQKPMNDYTIQVTITEVWE